MELVARLDFGLYGFRWLQVLSCFVPRKDPISKHRSGPPTGSNIFGRLSFRPFTSSSFGFFFVTPAIPTWRSPHRDRNSTPAKLSRLLIQRHPVFKLGHRMARRN